MFDSLVVPVTMKELIENGFLVPFELIAPEKPLSNNQIAMKPVDAYLKYATGRKAIVFSGNIPAARAHCDEFRAAGITCEVVWGEMDGGDRRRVLDDYKYGRVQVLTNVGVLTEGFDDKPTSCVILARSVGPLSLFLQMCGRALRASPSTAKDNAVVIDLHGSCRIHGSPDDDREWSLDGDGLNRKNLEQPKEKFCRVCKVTLEPGMDGLVCEFCQITKPEAVPPSVVNAKLVKYEHLQKDSPAVRRARFERLKQKGRVKGASPWQAVVIYQKLYGEKPPREWIFRDLDDENAA
jgi:DNA repair protein RadD